MDETEYRLDYFLTNSFNRYRCPSCRRYYWNMGEQKNCGEPPCTEYTFIDHSPTAQKLSLSAMREQYLNFFERNGHKRIHRYPIVARWRDDVFFTQASIYDFQPWVLNGTVKPPGNPLVVAQTCVRFNDIDNVGKTGRHFTMFEMLGHHAFNTRDEFIYFKDRTVELCHKLLTKELGIDASEITYIEEEWAGGGNAGPCLEVLVRGNELATLVFMMYTENGQRRPMDMQVVDTGYGLERLTWLSQGMPNAYEAVFGEILTKLKNATGIDCDPNILKEYSLAAGLIDIKSADAKKLLCRAAKRLGLSEEELVTRITPMEKLYAVCDHVRALIFMLNDGVVPSNVKHGYFARLLIRRARRALSALRSDLSLGQIAVWHIENLGSDFPELTQNRDSILALIQVEEERYEHTLKRGSIILGKLEKRLKEEGRDTIGLETLIELYDSHGLTPDIVKEMTSLKTNIPEDFYQLVAKRHEKIVGENAKSHVIALPQQFSPTKVECYDENFEFDARLEGIFGNFIVLDRSCFYPEGGGQEADYGLIEKMRVIDVQKLGTVVVHRVENVMSGLKPGTVLKCKIDRHRRLRLTRNHTATHIINGAAREILGNHVWQWGAHKSENIARLDITHYAPLNDAQLQAIERRANEIVRQNWMIERRLMDRAEAETKFGFRLYQGGAVPGKEIRVVNINNWDVEACGGTHCAHTGEVEQIKILAAKRIQDGVVRLEFVAGYEMIYHALQKEVIELSRRYNIPYIPSLPRHITPEMVEDLSKTYETMRKEAERLGAERVKSRKVQEKIKESELKQIVTEQMKSKKPVKMYLGTLTPKQMIAVARAFTCHPATIAIIGSVNLGRANITIARSHDIEVDCSEVMKKVLPLISGKGGGKTDFAQGSGPNVEKLKEAMEKAKEEIERRLSAGK